MSDLTLYTSGSTKEPKEINHSWEYINRCVKKSIKEIKLTESDIVLDVFPGNTIAHYTVTALPAIYSKAKLISANFEPYNYIKLFNKYQPTYISLIPRHYEILKNIKQWKNFDMSCVRYMVTGSGKVSQDMIDDFLSKGVKLVANWYGMTEFPPPVMIAYNSIQFTKIDNNVSFLDNGECIINGIKTGDIFNKDMTFNCRAEVANGNTWKTRV